MSAIKETVLNVLDYLKFQVESDRCTPTQMKSIADLINNELAVDATIDDIAELYGQSKSNVRNVLSRNRMPNPKRRVIYSFCAFLRSKPKSWRVRSHNKAAN